MKKLFFYVFLFSATSLLFTTCKDDNPYDDNYSPTGGSSGEVVYESVYDYLESQGNFTYYLKLVNSVTDVGVNYAEVLKLTGTKTIFVATDEAYDAFFADNPYGIKSFDDFTEAQKRAILFSGMLDDAYLMEMLASTPGNPPAKGQALRRYSSWQVLDNVQFETADMLPENPYWEPYKDQGIYILNDNSQWTMVHFLDDQMRANGITAMDFQYLTKTLDNPSGMQWDSKDAYIFDNRVIKKDVTCRNGYVNVLEQFRLPADNMAEHIRKNEDTKMFNDFMERFCAPFYDPTNTTEYQKTNPDFIGKKMYVKRFFAQSTFGGGTRHYPNENGESVTTFAYEIPTNLLLKFDPANSMASSAIQRDMGTMFVPTNEAFNDFFYNGAGKIMQERYGTWDNVPDDVMSVLLNNHMWGSFLQTTPSRFETIENSMGTSLNVNPNDVIYTSICSNGVIYHTNKVYTPAAYASVLAPVIFGEASKIMYWAVSELKFNLYLLSLENEFSFLVPTDDVFKNYISPVSVGKSNPERWDFRYITTASTAGVVSNSIDVVRYNMAGDSVGVYSTTKVADLAIIRNALFDIIDNHIIVGDIEDGKTFYKTKGGATVKVAGTGTNLTLDSGGNEQWDGEPAKVTSVYNQDNGKTYLLDKVVQTPTQSVYALLSDERFSEFFDLCLSVRPVTSGSGKDKVTLGGGNVFINKSGNVGITPNVSFFNTFNYTVYVPTNEAIQAALNSGRIRHPEDIMEDKSLSVEEQGEQMQNLYEFLRYHFQDNSVYLGGDTYSFSNEDDWFETATINKETGKFRRLYIDNDGTNLKVRSENGTVANVIKTGGLYNMMTRDYMFNGNVITSSSVNRIETSSFAVVHQIDRVLDFQP